MAGLSDLIGKHGVIEQLLLWGVVADVVRAAGGPGLDTLAQDVQAKHPVQVLQPELLAELEARGLIKEGAGKGDAARSGIDAARYALLADRAKVRLPPADLAAAVLRSAMTQQAAEAEAAPQGITAAQLGVLSDLAGDAPGPDELAVALRRKLIPAAGTGPASTSYEQGIAEGRLHNKWGPVVEQLARQLLSAPDAAEAVIRNFISGEQGQAAADAMGVDAETFTVMTHLAGDSPGPQQLAEALRRGVIELEGTGAGSTSFQQGIAEGRLAAKWAPVIQGLAQLWPTPDDAINATLKGELSAEDGAALYERLGGDPEFYAWLLASAGDAPSPLEAASMAARGIIPWDGSGPDSTSFAQAIREGRLRDKWTPAVRAATVYLPSPGEIITFLGQGALSKDEAADLLYQHNMTAEQVGWYLNEADLAATTDDRGLTQSQVVDLYKTRMITEAQALDWLQLLHMSQEAASLRLGYADMQQVYTQLQGAIRRISSLFTARKISSQTAVNALTELGVPQPGIESLMATWQIEAAASVKTLTATQIGEAFVATAFSQAEAMTELTNIGYTPLDAWAILCLSAKALLPDKPTSDIAPPPGTVIPGTT